MASLDRDSIRHIVLQLQLQRAVHCMRLLGPDFREEMDQVVTRLHLPPGRQTDISAGELAGLLQKLPALVDVQVAQLSNAEGIAFLRETVATLPLLQRLTVSDAQWLGPLDLGSRLTALQVLRLHKARHAARPWLQELRGLCSLRQLELLDASSRDIVGQLAPLSVLSQLTRVSLGLMAAQEQPVGVLAMLFQCVPQLQSLRCCNPLETVSELKCLEVGMHCLIGLLRPSHSGHDAALEAVVLDFWLTRRGPPSCSDHDRLLGRLQEASHLTSLQLDSCQHSNAHYTIHHISVSGRSLRHLNLGQLRLRSIEVVANFHMLAFLKSLELHRCVFARQNLQLVGHVSGLSSLMVSFPLSAHLAGSMPGLELALGRFAALKSVHIEVEAEWPMPRPAFSNPGVLGHLTELQSLTLRGLMLESAILDTIQLELPNLTHLSFEDSQMPEMETFGANLKDLQSLHIGAVGPYAVLTSQSLTSLTIDVLTERQAAWAFIGVGHTLKHFRADHCRCRGAALVHQILQPLTALMSLTLCDLQPDSPDMTVACLQKFLPGVDIELHHPSGVVEAS